MADDQNNYQNDYRQTSSSVDIEGPSGLPDYNSSAMSTSTGLNAFNDPTFMAELREYYANKGEYFNNDTDLIDTFYTDNQWQNMNTISLGKEVAEAYGADKRQRNLMIRMNEVFESLPNFYEEGGRGAKGLAINAAAAVTDPLNLIGFGAGGQAAKAALRETGKGALRAGIKQGAIAEGAVSGAAEGVFNSLEQARDIQLGIQDEYSFGQAGLAAGSGAVLGAGMGGVFGAAAAQYQKMGRSIDAPGTILRENRRLMELGYTDEDILSMPQSTVNQLLKTETPRPTITEDADVDADVETDTPDAPEASGRMPTDEDLVVDAERIAQEIQMAERDIVEARNSDPDSVDDLIERHQMLVDMAELNGRLSAYEDEIAPLLQSADPADVSRGQKRSIALTKLKTLYRSAFESGNPDDVKRVLDAATRVENSADIEDAAVEAGTSVDLADPEKAVEVDTEQPAETAEVETAQEVIPDDSTDLSDFSLTNTAKKFAEKNGITVGELTGVEAKSKTGRIGIDQIRKIVKARGKSEEVVTPDEPVEAPTKTKPKAKQQKLKSKSEIKYRSEAQAASIAKQLKDMGLTEDDFLGMINAGQIELGPTGKITQAGHDAFKAMRAKGATPKKEGAEPEITPTVFDDDIQITEVKYRGEAQKKSIIGILNKADLDEDDLADLIDDGIIPVTSKGVLTTQAQKNLRKYLKASKPKSTEAPDIDAFADTHLGKLADEVGEDVMIMVMRDDPETFRFWLNERVPDGRGDELADWAINLANNQDGLGPVASVNKTFSDGIMSLNTRDKKRLIEITNQLTEANPKLSREHAKTKALAILNKEKVGGVISDVPMRGSAGKTPIETTAGRNVRGRIQSFLRSTTDIGDGYSVIGRAPEVMPGTEGSKEGIIYGQDAAIDVARTTQFLPNEKGHLKNTETGRIVKYVSLGGERVYGTEKGRMKEYGDEGKKKFVQQRAKKGEVLYVDSRGKSYRSVELLDGYADARPKDGVNVDEPFIPHNVALRDAGAKLRAGGTMEEYLEAIKGVDAKEIVKETSVDSSDIPELPAFNEQGMRLAILPNDPDKNIRVLSNKQIDAGKGAKDLIGKMSEDEYTIGYVNSSSTTGSRLANDSFKPWKKDSVDDGSPTKSFLTQREASKEMVSISVGDLTRLSQLAESLPPQDDTLAGSNNVLQAINFLARKAVENGGVVSKSDIDLMVRRIDIYAGWPRDGFTESIKFIRDLYELKNKYVPEDIRLDTTTIKGSQKQLKNLSVDFSREDLAEGKRLVEMLAKQGGRGAPLFSEPTDEALGADSPSIGGSYDPATNKIQLVGRKSPGKKDIPNSPVHVLMHEMGHWVYSNMLSTKDKLEFWDSIAKYVDKDGNVNTGMVEEKLPANKALSDSEGVPSNIRSPQEFFADQFMMWVQQNKASGFMRSEEYGQSVARFVTPEFWKRISKYVMGVFNRINDPKNIDPDLEKIFARILPDPGEAMSVRDAAGPSTPAGQTLVKVQTEMDFLFGDVDDSISTWIDTGGGNPDTVVHAALELAKRLYGMSATGRRKEYAPLQLTQKTNAANAKLARRIFDELGVDRDNAGEFGELENIGISGTVVDEALAQRLVDILDGADKDGMPVYIAAHNNINKNLRSTFNRLLDEDLEMMPSGKTFAKRAESQYRKFQKEIYAKGRAARTKKKRIAAQKEKAATAVVESKQTPEVTDTQASQSPSYKTAPESTLEGIVQKAMDKNKLTDEALQAALELEARKNTRRIHGDLDPIEISDPVAMDAVQREIRESNGIDSNTLSPSGPASVREAQEKIGHHTKREGFRARSLFLRLNNISEASDEGIAQRLIVAAQGNEFDPLTASTRDTFDNDFSSDAFSSLRNKMRNISKLLSRGEAEGVEQVVEMVIRLEGNDPSITIKDVMNRMEGGDADVDEAIIDRVALVLNGHLNENLRGRYPELDRRGNLFHSYEFPALPQRNPRLTSNTASDYGSMSWEVSSPSRKRAVNEFVADGMSNNGTSKPTVFYNPSRAGEGIVEPQQTEYGSAVTIYTKPSHADALDNGDVISGDIGQQRRELNDKAVNANEEEAEALNDVIASLDEMIEAQEGKFDSPEPVYVNAKNLADFRPEQTYKSDSSFTASIVERLIADEHITSEQASKAGLNQPEVQTGPEIEDMLLGMIDPTGKSSNRAHQTLKKTLIDLGYEGVLKSEEVDGRQVMSALVFDGNKVRPVDHSDFDTPPVGDDAAPMDTLKSVMPAILDSKTLDVDVGQPQTTAVVQALINSGVNPNAASGMGKMMNGKFPDKRESSAIQRAVTVSIGSNSERLRQNGMNWVADWIAPARDSGVGHFERTNGRTGGILIPIFKEMRKLKDAKSSFGNWLRRSTDLSFKGSDAMRMDQPKSHKKIVNALRNQPGGRHEAQLKDDEKAVYKMVRAAFSTLRREMVDAGVMIGNIENYFPQVWSMEKVLQNEADFKERLIRYFALEAKEEGRTLTREVAEAQAQRVFGHIVDEDGVYVEPPTGGSRDVTGDHIDYQRMIRLDKYPELLNDVGRYLEDDLESVLAKYVDSASRRIDFAAKYGNQSHGFHDYMSVVEDQGDTTDAVAKLLMTKKITSKTMRSINGETGAVDEGELVRETLMPFENDGAGAKGAARELLRMAENGASTPEMLAYLRGFDESADAADKAVFSKRSEAIVGAVQDRVRMGNQRPHNDHVKAAQEIFRAVQRKPVGASGAGYSMQNSVSKAVRNFNSVSLLSFTTLTSLGDPMLTAVRSGSPMAFTKAVSKFASDPHYRSFIANAGLAIENVVHERLTGMHGTAASKNTVAFFNATMLTPWTNLNRNLAGAVGLEFFFTEYDRALANYNPNMSATQQNKAFKKSFRVLRRYGLDKYLDDGMTSLRSITDFKEHPELRSALNKFANESIFTPNPNDVPLWAQTPVGAVMFQLKSYPLMLGRLVNDSIKQATEVDPITGGGRRFGPLAMLATAAPLGGGLSLAAKDLVQRRGEDDETFRERKFSKIAESFGFDPDIHGDKDEFVGWYMESMIQIGGLGLIANMFYDAAEQLDNGAYGKQRIASTIFGPSVGLMNDAINVAQGLSDGIINGDENGTGKERSAARSVVGRIPVVGGVRTIKEDIVDTVAGKVKKKGNNGWDNSGWKEPW